MSSVTEIYIDDEDDDGTNIESFLRTIDDSTSSIKGHFKITNKSNAHDFALFTISSSSEQTGYHIVSCSYISGSASSFSNEEDILITFARTGDKGDTGSQGTTGSEEQLVHKDQLVYKEEIKEHKEQLGLKESLVHKEPLEYKEYKVLKEIKVIPVRKEHKEHWKHRSSRQCFRGF